MYVAVLFGKAECVKVLSAFGASRTLTATAEVIAQSGGHAALRAWLVASREWTPLHHVRAISARRARAPRHDGADIHAAASGATPLSLAQTMHAAGDAADGSAAHVVLRAAQLWSRTTHALFPAASRARAVTLLLLGLRLVREPRFEGEAGALADVWVEHVLPFAVARQ